MADGKFITFEGPEGAGKSTQLKLCAEYLRSKNMEVITTREPGGTPLAEQLRGILKTHSGDEKLHPETELLLMEAARSQHMRELILPALERGCTVLCDRFYDSTSAYQGAARGLDKKYIDILNAFAVGECHPDLTFLLDISPERGFARAEKRPETQGCVDRFEEAGLDFHRKVRQGFHDIAAADPQRVKTIDADRPADVISAEIRGIVNESLL